MARVTVEDGVAKVGNRFELVLLASKRARQLASTGTKPKVSSDNDKVTVLALREIEGGFVDAAVVAAEEEQRIEPLHLPSLE